MDINETSAVIRPRQGWEAIDLGFLMAKKWFAPALKPWLLISLPLYAILFIAFYPNSTVTTLVFWWLKPIWERIPLYIYSQALFGTTPSVKDTLRAFPKIALHQGFQAITVRRFSPTRSFDQPVNQLERLGGVERHNRLRVLHYNDSGAAFSLLVILAHIEIFFALAIATLIYLFIPENVEIDWYQILFGDEDAYGLAVIEAAIYYCVITVVAMFYVGAGFSLYLNRRTLLEGWDIELAFKRLINRVGQQRLLNSDLKLLFPFLICVAIGGAFTPNDSVANQTNQHLDKQLSDNQVSDNQVSETLSEISEVNVMQQENKIQADVEEPDQDKDIDFLNLNKTTSYKAIDQILAGDDFHDRTTQTLWKPKSPKDDNEEPSEFTKALLEFIKGLFSFRTETSALATVIKYLLWGLMIVLIIVTIIKYRHWLANIKLEAAADGVTGNSPKILFGMDVTEESLPMHPADKALKLWQDQQYREAIGLLYRATLARLVTQYQFNLADSQTEMECLAAIDAEKHGAIYSYLKQLTQVWQKLAYGHHLPSHDTVATLCQKWNIIFQTPVPINSSELDGEDNR